MTKIAVVDDSHADALQLITCLNQFFGENKVTMEILEFSDPVQFIHDYQKYRFDMIFFDVDMPGMNGILAARQIRDKDEKVKIVFVTNYPQFAIDGYGINALDYIVKPIIYDRFSLKLNRILPSLVKDNDKQLTLTNRGVVTVIPINKIIYIEVTGHNLTIHIDGRADVTYRESLSVIENKLIPSGFARCNACYLVNLHYVTQVKNDDVYIGDTPLKISRQKKKDFMTAFAASLNRGF